MSKMNKVIAGSIVGASALVGMTTILNADEVKQVQSNTLTMMVAKQDVFDAKNAVQIAMENVNKAKTAHDNNTKILNAAKQKLADAQQNLQNKLVVLNNLKQEHKQAADKVTADKLAEKEALTKFNEAQFNAENRERELEATQQQQTKAEDVILSIEDEKRYLEQKLGDVTTDLEEISELKNRVESDVKQANEDVKNAYKNLENAPSDQEVQAADNAQQVLGDKARAVEQTLIAAGRKANDDLQKANEARMAVKAAEEKLNDLLNEPKTGDEEINAQAGWGASLEDIKKAEAELLAARTAYEAAENLAQESVRAADELEYNARKVFEAADAAYEKFQIILEEKERAEYEVNNIKERRDEIQHYLESVLEEANQIKSIKTQVTNDLNNLSKSLDDAIERAIELNDRVKALQDEETIQKLVDDAKKNLEEAQDVRGAAEEALAKAGLAVEKARFDVLNAHESVQAAEEAVSEAQVNFDASKLALEQAEAELEEALKAQLNDEKKPEPKPKVEEKSEDSAKEKSKDKVKENTEDKAKQKSEDKVEPKNVVPKRVDTTPMNKDVKQVGETQSNADVQQNSSHVRYEKNGTTDKNATLPKTGSESQESISIMGALIAGLTIWGFGFKKRG